MSATKKSADEEWDETASRAEWEKNREKRRKTGDLTPELEGTTWEEVRGFRRGIEIGDGWERDVTEYLRLCGLSSAERWSGDSELWQRRARRVLGYPIPPPDIVGIPGWTLELKNRKTAQWVSLGNFLDQMQAEKRVTKDQYGAVISKRRGWSTGNAYVVMCLDDWVELLLDKRNKRG